MPHTQPSFLTYHDLLRELSTARGELNETIASIRSFSLVVDEKPWVHLDDLVRDLRSQAVTIAVLEQQMDKLR